MPQIKACLFEQDRSPPGPRRVVVYPDGDLHCGRGATHARFVTKPNAERERSQPFDQRQLATAEDDVYPVAA